MTIKTDLTRRSFMKSAAAGAGAVAVPMALTGCGADDDNDSTTASDSNLVVAFGHGVASGDPLHDRVIIWTRVTPSVDDATAQKTVPVDWKVLQLGASQYDWSSVKEKEAEKSRHYLPCQLHTCGSFALALVAIFPYILMQAMDVGYDLASFFGGTSLLIIVGVALDTLQQIESHLLMRHYDGFLKTGKLKGRDRR